MSAPDKAEYELLTEHFGYPPVSLLDDIINAVNVLADRAVGAVESALLKLPAQNIGFGNSKKRNAPGADPNNNTSPEQAAKREIENGTHQLETLLNATIDKNFDIFELYTMQNILTVKPVDQPFMELAHYQGLDFNAAAAAAAAAGLASGNNTGVGGGGSGKDAAATTPTVESVTQLRRRLHASQKLQVALETERVRNDALLKKLRAALGVKATTGSYSSSTAPIKKEENEDGEAGGLKQGNAFGFLRDRGTLEEGGTVRPITTTTEFTLSQLQALRSLSSSLRTLIPQISNDDGDQAEGEEDGGDEEKSWRRERTEYVESATRRYLETVGGVELGPAGEVRDGEWQGPGRGLARDEVEGLEKVVAALGASSSSSSGGGGTATAGAAKVVPAHSGEDDAGGRDNEEMDQS